MLSIERTIICESLDEVYEFKVQVICEDCGVQVPGECDTVTTRDPRR